MKKIILILLTIIIAQTAEARIWMRAALDTGLDGSLDSLSSTADWSPQDTGVQPLKTGDLALTAIGQSAVYWHVYDAASTLPQSTPSVIAPDDIGVNPGRWIRVPPFLLPADITGLATVATSGDYNDLLNKPTTITIAQANAITANTTHAGSAHAPVGAEQNVNADWLAATGDAQILNKPTIPTDNAQIANGAGYITGYSETDPLFTAWNKSTGISITEAQISDLQHTVNTTLTEAQVDAYADNNGYLTSYTETDPTVNALSKATLTCTTDQIPKFNGTDWVCAADSGTGGTADHSLLLNLDYATAGHTGFSPTVHTHTEADISDLYHYNSTDFGTDLATKSTTDLAEGLNLYYTEARVTANTNVAANTTNRHAHTNTTNLDLIDQDLSTTASPTFAGVTINGADGDRAVSLLDNTVAVACLPNDYRIYPQNGVWEKCENGTKSALAAGTPETDPTVDTADKVIAKINTGATTTLVDTVLPATIARDSELPTNVSQLNNDESFLPLAKFGDSIAGTFTSGGGLVFEDYLYGAAWSDSLRMFVVVGSGDLIFTSTDSQTWVQRTGVSAGTIWSDIIWVNDLSLFVAVGGSKVMTSPDGINWTLQTSGISGGLLRLIWVPELSKLIAVGQPGIIISSSDAITWTTETSGATGWLYSVGWSNTLSLLVAHDLVSSDVYTSPDGITWTTGTSGSVEYTQDVEWSPALNMFATAGYNGEILTSPDGITWTKATYSSTVDYKRMLWVDDLQMFIAIGLGGTTVTSVDGVNWVEHLIENHLWTSLAWSPVFAKFVATIEDTQVPLGESLSPYDIHLPYKPPTTTQSLTSDTYDSNQDGIIDDAAIASTITRDAELATVATSGDYADLINKPATGITVQEEDATPTVSTATIKFANGTVTDNGDGTVSIANGGGTVDLTAPGPIGTVTPDVVHATDIVGDTITLAGPVAGTTEEIALREDPANPGGNMVIIKAKADIAADMTWYPPIVDGNAGDVWVTDGAGDLTMAANYLTEATVDGYCNNNGYLTSYTETDPTVDTSDEIVTIINNTPGTLLSEATIDPLIARDSELPLPVTAPTLATDTCTAGQWAYDASYHYICTATDTWMRAALATW